MSDNLKKEFQQKIQDMLKLDRHNNHKGDELKKWALENFNLSLAVGMIIEEKQRRNRILEQQRHDPEILIFVCDFEVNRDKVIEEIKKLLYKNLKNICIIGYDAHSKTNKKIKYEAIYNLQNNEFSKFAKTIFEKSIILNNDRESEDDMATNGIGKNDNKKIDIFSIKRKERKKDSKYPLCFIVYGAPGTSKTYNMPNYAMSIIKGISVDEVEKKRNAMLDEYNSYIKKGRIVFTTFHQNYGYEDFIQGLRPDVKQEGLKFKIVDGVFKKIADNAMLGGDEPYVIIIDEINRGNISKIFGELITLIEEDKRWGEKNQMCVTLPSGDVFAIPNNLYIIGTMNSADKSISLIDAALRRRFSFIEMVPDKKYITDKNLKVIFDNMNSKLNEMLDSSDLLIGHSYFIDKKMDDFGDIMNKNIIPLLYEYFYDNKNKVSKFLTDILKDTGYKKKDNEFGRLTIEKGN